MNWTKSKNQRDLEQAYIDQEIETRTFYAWLPVLDEDTWRWFEYVTMERMVYYKVKRRCTRYFWCYV